MNLIKLSETNKGKINFKLFALIALVLIQLNYSYSQCDTINCNSKLTGSFGNYTQYQTRNNFYDNLVPCWVGVKGTPHIITKALSTPSAALIYSYYYGTTAKTLNNEAFGQRINLTQGHKYILSYYAKRDSLGLNKNGSIIVTFNRYYSYQFTQCNCGTGYGLSFQWTKCSCCFTAPRNTNFISFESLPLSPIQAGSNFMFWSRIDDSEIWEIKAEAGPDTLLCDSGCVWLGVHCNNPTLHINRTFKWYIAGSTTVIDTLSRIHVCPLKTTTYVLKVNFDDCYANDSVTVKVSNKPNINIGNDTIICGPINDSLDEGYDSSYIYNWSTGSTNHSININSGGNYWVQVTNDAGCVWSDTVKIIQRPEFKIYPKDTIVCFSSDSFDIKVFVTSFDSIRWSTGDTTQTIRVKVPGNYIVSVYDSGCFATDTANVIQISPPYLYIGPDTIKICEDSIILCDTNTWLYERHLLHYRWGTTSDTNRCKTFYQSANVILYGWMTDSTCRDSDIVTLIFIARPQITCLDTTVCDDAEPFSVKRCWPKGGVYDVDSTFAPSDNEPGTFYIPYVYTYNQDPTCTVNGGYTITVNPKPNIYHDSVNQVLCITDPSITISFHPTGGLYQINGTDADSIFYPLDYGLGEHIMTYQYTDSIGCSNIDSVLLLVLDTFNVSIKSNYTNFVCSGQIELEAIVSDTGSFTYLWKPNNEKTSKIFADTSGTYWVYVSNLANCNDSDSIIVNIGDYCDSTSTIEPNNDTNNNQPITGYYVNSDTTWLNEIIISAYNIIIPQNVTLIINKSSIYMKGCTKIIVQSGGHLIIDSSGIGGCDWKGIEVWGWWDACSDDYYWQGKLEVNHSSICHADIGIFAGQRNGTAHDRAYSGGVLIVKNSAFSNNYVDIMFSDWNVGGICLQNPDPPCRNWQSSIDSNYFDRLAGNYFCDDYVDVTINLYNSFYSPPNLPPSFDPVLYDVNRCHIVDLSPYWEVGQNQQPIIYNWNWCERAIWKASPASQFTDNITNFNRFWEDDPNNPCGCRCTIPNDASYIH
jgi:hypothetical protein